jgi:Domain of unknown function (DUF6362)
MLLTYDYDDRTVEIDEAVDLAHDGLIEWDRGLVKHALRRAATALMAWRMLGSRDYPAGIISNWPDVVFTVEELANHAMHKSNAVRPATPSPAELDRTDKAICWLLPLSRDARRVVWAKAARPALPWSWLGDYYGVSRSTIKRRYYAAIDEIVQRRGRLPSQKKIA